MHSCCHAQRPRCLRARRRGAGCTARYRACSPAGAPPWPGRPAQLALGLRLRTLPLRCGPAALRSLISTAPCYPLLKVPNAPRLLARLYIYWSSCAAVLTYVERMLAASFVIFTYIISASDGMHRVRIKRIEAGCAQGRCAWRAPASLYNDGP